VAEAQAKDRIWRPLGRYLQRWVPLDGVVLDIASDRGHFINNIVAAEKWASDVRDTSDAFGSDVRFICSDGLRLLDLLPASHFDCVFMSNYLEHLQSSELVIDQLAVVRRLLKPGGRAIVLQPNIRLTGAAYWDFIDHKVALTERSLDEAARVAGLTRRACITRFLPYTTKSRLPKAEWLVRAYLAFPPAWWLFGKQTLFIAERPEAGDGA
jgi:SAM-dependent methyltransferase